MLAALANQNSLLTTKGYLEQSEHYIESRLDASSENSSALYDASKDPFHDPGPHFELMSIHFKKILIVSMLEYKSSQSPGLQVASFFLTSPSPPFIDTPGAKTTETSCKIFTHPSIESLVQLSSRSTPPT